MPPRTTGGAGGSTTTVSTLAQFTQAAESSDKKVVVVSGNISGSAKVRVKSNKTIVGKAGSSKYTTSRHWPHCLRGQRLSPAF